jgi:hypothetical protein
MIERLERVPLREVWKHEALDFRRWLEENIDILNELLDLNLASADREQAAGTFSVDLVAEDESGDPVVIENQLDKSDHNHLGKLITYLTAIGSKVAIWIVSDPRPEHVKAIAWLNESSGADFYLLKVEALRIGESPPAPLLTLITGPSEESRQVGQTKKELAERYHIRHRFWTELLAKVKEKTNLFASISPGKENWIGTGAGMYGLGFNFVIRKHDVHVELYIDRGKGAEEENERIFDQLGYSEKEIEKNFGDSLSFERLKGRRACRIAKRLALGGYRDEDRWPEIQEAMIDAMVRLEKALKPRIRRLKQTSPKSGES